MIQSSAATTDIPSFASARLTERALLVALNIREWRGRRRDREVTNRIARENGAESAAGCYTKTLVPKTFLATIGQVRSEAREVHQRLTLPWCDDGARILPVELHLGYMSQLRDLRSRFHEAVLEFLAAYDDAKRGARVSLGTLYRDEDYPSTDHLREAFGLEIHLQPLPSAQDWRIDLPETTVGHIRWDLEARLEEAQRLGMADLYRRLAAVVSRIATTLAKPDGIFRDSLIGNVRDLCEILPSLNLAHDADLASLTREIEERLAGLAPSLLRNDPTGRQNAAVTAAALLETITERLASYTGAASA